MIHQNAHYLVVYVPESESEYNYQVRNIQFQTIEYSCDALPEALSVAENFNDTMVKRSYMREQIDMFDAERVQPAGTVQ